MNEAEFTRRVCQHMRGKGAKVVALVASKRSEPGLPDRVIVWRGASFWCEFKGVRTPLGLNQHMQLQELARRGVPALLVRQTEENACAIVQFGPGGNYFCEIDRFHAILEELLNKKAV